MMRRRVACLFAVVLAVSCLCYAEKTQEFENHSGAKATGLRVVFTSSTRITSYGDAFSTVTPTGRASEFVFSGGSVFPFGTFTVSWDSDAVTVRSFEWLTGNQPGSSTPAVKCDITVSATYPNLREAIERAWDGAVICVEPGTYDLSILMLHDHNFTLRGMGQTASDVVVKGPKYQDLAGLYLQGSSTVVLDNLKVEEYGVVATDASHITLRNVIAERVMAMVESAIEIENSILLDSEGHGGLSVSGGTHVSVRNSVVESPVSVTTDAQLATFDSIFRGPTAKVAAGGKATLEIRACTFDALSPGISLYMVDFAGTVLGEGNIIAPSQLSPSGYAWPAGFIKK